ncbi:hypothetical protein ACWCOV_29495 [Kribbella sp. NPDC002412]
MLPAQGRLVVPIYSLEQDDVPSGAVCGSGTVSGATHPSRAIGRSWRRAVRAARRGGLLAV